MRRKHIPSLFLLTLMGVHLWAWFGDSREYVKPLDWAVIAATVAFAVAIYVTARRPQAAARLALLSGAIVASVAVCEVGLRWTDSQPNMPWRPNQRIERDRTIAIPGISAPAQWTTNSIGARGPEPDGSAVRILTVGGSTTECFYNDDLVSWPWQVQRQLRERGVNAYVANVGKSGHHALHHEILLREWPHAADFDVVVLLVGQNEMTRMLFGTYQVLNPPVFQDQPRRAAERFYYRRLRVSTMLRDLITPEPPADSGRHVVMDGRGWFLTQRPPRRREVLASNPIDRMPSLDSELVVYDQRLRAIFDLCQQRGQTVLALTQPSLYAKPMPPEHEEMIWYGVNSDYTAAFTTDLMRRTLKAVNQQTVETSRAMGVAVLDLTSRIPQSNKFFYDDCHFTDAGCDAVARIVADHLAMLLAD